MPSRTSPKIQRWVDLLAALLARRQPATFEELSRDVPAYLDGKQSKAARMRMFERDKDELRAFGVPIVSVTSADGETHGYKLAPTDFYLPYLALLSELGATKPKRVDRWGYRALQTLAFEPDELAAVADAAARVAELGDPLLAADADAAMRKLAFDLPVDGARTDRSVHLVDSGDRIIAATFNALSDALLRRKTVRFDYHAMGSDSRVKRCVEPYGLFFLSGHWYLVGRDCDRDGLRNFRVSRMSSVETNTARSQTPDFEIPSTFSLRDHARSRHAWELGENGATIAIVEFRGGSGATDAAARLGEPVAGQPQRRRFQVSRRDAFARWLLSFAGEVVPVEPASLVEEYQTLARQTLAHHAGVA
ncbi:MAG: helix-turn-helix transcriptional regulator [Gemmatimonadaceae bacterium]